MPESAPFLDVLAKDPIGRIVLRVREQVMRLTKLASFSQNQIDNSEVSDEILRALVVFGHATLEDTVREAVRRRWRDWQPDYLDKIPYPGGRTPKATIRDLRGYSGISIDELIEKAVNDYLDSKSVSSTTELCSLLASIGIDIAAELAELSKIPSWEVLNLTTLQQLMERRHRIVHYGDYNEAKTRNPIQVLTVLTWLAAVFICCVHLMQLEAERNGESEDIREAVLETLDDMLHVRWPSS